MMVIVWPLSVAETLTGVTREARSVIRAAARSAAGTGGKGVGVATATVGLGLTGAGPWCAGCWPTLM